MQLPPEDSGWFGYDEFPPDEPTPIHDDYPPINDEDAAEWHTPIYEATTTHLWNATVVNYCPLCQTAVLLPDIEDRHAAVIEGHFADHLATIISDANTITREAAK